MKATNWWKKERKKIEEFYKGTRFLYDALYIFNKCESRYKKELKKCNS